MSTSVGTPREDLLDQLNHLVESKGEPWITSLYLISCMLSYKCYCIIYINYSILVKFLCPSNPS